MSKNSKKNSKLQRPKKKEGLPGYNINMTAMIKEQMDKLLKFSKMEGFQPDEIWLGKIVPEVEKIILKYCSHVSREHLLVMYTKMSAMQFVVQTMKSLIAKAKTIEMQDYLKQQETTSKDKPVEETTREKEEPEETASKE